MSVAAGKVAAFGMPVLRGKSALVTGAGRGIGQAIAVSLARAGAFVFLCARTAAQVRRVEERIRRMGLCAEAFAADVSCEEDVKSLFSRIRSRKARLDILVNNAGVGRFGPIERCSAEEFDEMMAVNARGTFLCCREAVPLMSGRKGGVIINIASVVGIKGYAEQIGYTASKHAVVGLTKALAAEARSRNINVAVILPGGVDTEMVRRARPDIRRSELLKPCDVAQAVMYLLSLSPRAWVDSIYLRRRASAPF